MAITIIIAIIVMTVIIVIIITIVILLLIIVRILTEVIPIMSKPSKPFALPEQNNENQNKGP